MHPPFYVPAHRAEPTHPRPVGVKKIVKRSQPERLDLSLPPPGYPLLAPIRPHPPAPLTRPAWQRRLGHALIRLGRALAGELPVADVKGRG